MAKKEVYTAVLAAQESKLQEFTAALQSESDRKNCFRIARQMAREGRDVISVCCMKNDAGNVVSDADVMKNIWRKYMETLLHVENDWDGEVNCPDEGSWWFWFKVLIRTVMALCTEDCTVVRTDAGLSEYFEVKVHLHHGSEVVD